MCIPIIGSLPLSVIVCLSGCGAPANNYRNRSKY